MDSKLILQKVTSIFKDVLDNEEIHIENSTTANDVEEWDSLSHIQLIVEIEKQFKIKFTSPEIRDWKSVGEMIACIEKKI